jgi:competence ComEA-like helix-hairpin-helix protein
MAEEKINLNTAEAKVLTQLPGVAKNLAHQIVNHRKQHGYFTAWEELQSVKGFPVDVLEAIKERASIDPPPDAREGFAPPRHLSPQRVADAAKKPAGYTKAIRNTRRQDKYRAA